MLKSKSDFSYFSSYKWLTGPLLSSEFKDFGVVDSFGIVACPFAEFTFPFPAILLRMIFSSAINGASTNIEAAKADPIVIIK